MKFPETTQEAAGKVKEQIHDTRGLQHIEYEHCYTTRVLRTSC